MSPQLYEAFTFLKGLGAVSLVHAENGDLIAQVSGVCPHPFLLSHFSCCKGLTKAVRALSREVTGQRDQAKDWAADETLQA